MHRLVRVVGLSLPGLLLLMWVWSYVDRLQLPALSTFDYPREARGGEILVVPRFDSGSLNIRYCRVIPDAPDRSMFLDRWGFRYTLSTDHRYKPGPFVERNTYAPIGFYVVLTLPPAVLCLAWDLWIRRVHNRILHGLCVHCGYNLTGNVSGVCPECGIEMSVALLTESQEPGSSA